MSIIAQESSTAAWYEVALECKLVLSINARQLAGNMAAVGMNWNIIGHIWCLIGSVMMWTQIQ